MAKCKAPTPKEMKDEHTKMQAAMEQAKQKKEAMKHARLGKAMKHMK